MSWRNQKHIEGPANDTDIKLLRERQIRNIIATLLLSQGTPMILAGDEFGRTQQGNNNAYCQDSEISWVNWDLKEQNEALTNFVRRLIVMRHKYPILRRNRFLTGMEDESLNIKDLIWVNADGTEMDSEDWNPNTKCFGAVLDGRSRPTGLLQKGKDITVLIVFNAYHDMVKFKLPDTIGGLGWSRIIDTNLPDEEDGPVFKFGDYYDITGRSLLLFALENDQKT